MRKFQKQLYCEYDNRYHPYHIQRVQALLERDFAPRLEICRWISGEYARNQEFLSLILFTDEAQFTRDGTVNFHNNHTWATENPHSITQCRHQQQFSVNVWAGILSDYLIGPFFPRILNGKDYLHFLENNLQTLDYLL